MSAPVSGIGSQNPKTGIGAGPDATTGDVVNDGDSVTVKPDNDVSPQHDGTADISSGDLVVTLPQNVAMVAANETVAIATSAGSNVGSGSAFVNVGALTNVRLPAGIATVSDGTTTVLSKHDNTGLLLASLPLHVVNDVLENAALPGGAAILTDGQSSIDIWQYDNSGSLAATVGVANNNLTVKLANATTRILINGLSVDLKKSDGTASIGTSLLSIDQGALVGAKVAATQAILADQQAGVTVKQQDGTAGASISVAVAANVAALQLTSAGTRIISDQTSCEVKSVAGVSSGFSGLLGISTAQLTGLTLPADVAIVQNGTGIAVPVTGTYTSTITPQVNASGVITGFVLS